MPTALWNVLATAPSLGGGGFVEAPLATVVVVAVVSLGLYTAMLVGALRRYSREPEARPTWAGVAGFAGIGLLSWGLQTLALLQQGTAASRPPLNSLLVWLPALALLSFAVAAAPPRRSWSASRLLDGAIFSVAAYLGLWMALLRPLFATHPASPSLLLATHGVFALACAGLGNCLHVLIQRGDPLRSPLGFIALGLALCVACLPWWVSLQLAGGFHFGHPVRLALIPGFLVLALAPGMPWPTTLKPRRVLAFLLPYLPASAAFVAFLVETFRASTARDLVGLALLGVLALLVLARQALTLRQLARLNHTLEARVEARTRELTRSQALLLETQQKNMIATLGAGLSHDFNNLLGAALGNLDLIRLKHPGEDPREIAALEQALNRASDLSKRLMNLAREGETSQGTFHLDTHLADLQPLLRAMVPRAIHLACEPGAVPLEVRGHPGQVDQVVVNLVSNAKDATPVGGTICLRARAEGPEALIEVSDTGSGIDPALMPRLFEPFLTTKPAGKGTGLGLSSVRAVVDQLGGRIEVRSRPGEGTTFTVRLPRASGDGG